MDEANEILSRGFKKQIYKTFKHLSHETQVALLSATMQLMFDPVCILVKRDELTLEDVEQCHTAVEKEEWKPSTLCDLYETVAIAQVVRFPTHAGRSTN